HKNDHKLLLTRSAVFPLAVGPVTTVNWPSGNTTLISFSSNLEMLSSALLVEASVIVVSSFEVRLALGFSSGDSFHLKKPDRIPRPVSSGDSPGRISPLLRVDTCSETSSSSKYFPI